jgi:hypothetical protein
MEASMSEHQGISRTGELQGLEQASFFRIDDPRLSDDIDKGVKEISLTIFGSDNKKAVRAIYHLLESSNSLPAWKLGSMWCMRKSTFRAKIWMAERRAWRGESQEDLVRLHIVLSNLLKMLSARPRDLDTAGDRSELRLIIVEAITTMQRALRTEVT